MDSACSAVEAAMPDQPVIALNGGPVLGEEEEEEVFSK